MTAIFYLLGVVIFALAIAISIGLHELGHMIPAKRFGAKVTQYFIGFGPTVWSRRVGETEYGFKAIPLGGYVKIVGMLPPGAEHLVDEVEVDERGQQVIRIRKSNTGMFAQLVAESRAAEWETIQPEDSERLFYKLAWWKKVIVMAGGPLVNVLIAFFLFLGIFGLYGVKSLEPQAGAPVVDSVSDCVLPAGSTRACTPEDPVAPAKQAGLKTGDKILSFNGTAIKDWAQFQTLIRGNENGAATLVVERDGADLTLSTNTTVTARPTSATDETLEQVGFLGIAPQAVIVTEKGGPIFTLQQMGDMTVRTVHAIVQLPVNVFKAGKAVVGLEERDPEGPVSVVGGGRFAGETVSEESFPIAEKVVFLLSLIAGFNFFIGMFNLVPLLPLDGGHIAGALWEALRRGLARLRGRPDPGHVDVAKMLPVAYLVGAAMMLMGVVLIVADLVAPLSITG